LEMILCICYVRS